MAQSNVQMPNRIIIGYGNPGRQDDGVGPALVKTLCKESPLNIQLETRYQLSVEDALDIADYDQVIFVDASLSAEAPFEFYKLTEEIEPTIGSHSISPAGVLTLCESLYGKQPETYILGIAGYEYDRFEEKLSEKCEENMLSALTFLKRWLSDSVLDSSSSAQTNLECGHA